jgi:hypothetical protein
MNASSSLCNPYIAGPPVYGKDFYGRSRELWEVLGGSRKFIWFISTRRMGKTSLLAQITYLCQHEPEYNEQYRCLHWDLQGNPSLKRLRKKLTLRPNQPLIPEIDFSSLESDLNCSQVIEFCQDTVSEKGLKLLLLIDEPDVFLTLVENGQAEFLDELNECLQLDGVRTVITSTYRLDRLALINPLLTQFERFFITPFDPEDGKALVCQTNIPNHPPSFVRDDSVIKEILDKANNSPFFIQKICGYLYPDKDITKIRARIFDLREFDPYFTSDFSGLEDTEKAILYFMTNKEEKYWSASEILRGAKEFLTKGIESIPTQRNLDVMTSLNILRHENENYYLANPFFRSWLFRDKENLFRGVIRGMDHKINPNGRRIMLDDIRKIEVEISSLTKLLGELERKYDDGDIDTAQYFKMRLKYLKQNELAIASLNNTLRENGVGALADAVEKLSTTRDDQELHTDMERVAREGESKGWGTVVHETIEQEKGPIAQTVLKTALNVAKFLL